MHGASCAEFMAMIFTVSEIAFCCCCLFQDLIFFSPLFFEEIDKLLATNHFLWYAKLIDLLITMLR